MKSQQRKLKAQGKKESNVALWKDHYTQPRLPLLLRNLLEAAAVVGIHQRLALPQVAVEVVHLKLRMYQAGTKTTHCAKFTVSYPSTYVHGI